GPPAGEPGSIVLCQRAAEDQDFLEQLVNSARVENEHGKVIWEKKLEHEPDDFRDALVIARVMAETLIKGNPRRVELWLATRRNPHLLQQSARPRRPTLRLPDGRAFLVTER